MSYFFTLRLPGFRGFELFEKGGDDEQWEHPPKLTFTLHLFFQASNWQRTWSRPRSLANLR